MKNLKELRLKTNLSQLQASKIFGISIRSYRDYENNPNKVETIKYKYFVEAFEKMLYIDEDTGLLTLENIKQICGDVFKEFEVTTCYLFGSYAKGKQNPKSDVDLLIDTEITGMKFLGLIEILREKLHKKVHLLDLNQVLNNKELLHEILKDGIKIYG